MTVNDLLNQIKELPISVLDSPVHIGTAKENYPYGAEIESKEAYRSTLQGNKFIIYEI